MSRSRRCSGPGREVVFTSGGTEAINAATWGRRSEGTHVVCPEVEHSAVRDASERLDVTWVGVDATGRVDPDRVMAAVEPGRTALVHLQWGNHEVGTLQPVTEVVAACRAAGVLVHIDAAQAAGHVAVDFDALGADLMSVSAHKLGGPHGAGALLVRRGLRLRPLLVGGEQERATGGDGERRSHRRVRRRCPRARRGHARSRSADRSRADRAPARRGVGRRRRRRVRRPP